MKKFTISEFANLRGTTAETLRHYDRIGLLKPDLIDKSNGYRYYTIEQHEQLGTIMELRQLGLTLDDIKNYLDSRNINKTKLVLTEALKKVEEQIQELRSIEDVLKNKVDFLDTIANPEIEYTPKIKTISERYTIRSDHSVKSYEELTYGWSLLEKSLMEVSPIFATNRICWTVQRNKLKTYSQLNRTPCIFTYDLQEGGDVIEAGEYISIYYKGHSYNEKAYEVVLDYINKNHYIIDGDLLCFMQVDMTITDKDEERLCEMQIKIKA